MSTLRDTRLAVGRLSTSLGYGPLQPTELLEGTETRLELRSLTQNGDGEDEEQINVEILEKSASDRTAHWQLSERRLVESLHCFIMFTSTKITHLCIAKVRRRRIQKADARKLDGRVQTHVLEAAEARHERSSSFSVMS